MNRHERRRQAAKARQNRFYNDYVGTCPRLAPRFWASHASPTCQSGLENSRRPDAGNHTEGNLKWEVAEILDREITNGGAKAFADKIAALDGCRRVAVELDGDRGAFVDRAPLDREWFVDRIRAFAGSLWACGSFEIW
jgi:hypothetical protein